MTSRAVQLAGVLGVTALSLVCAAAARGFHDGARSAPAVAAAPTTVAPQSSATNGSAIERWRVLEQQRLAPPELSSLAQKGCPPLARELAGHSSVLQLTTADARVEPKQLLPLALTAALTTRPALAALEDQLLGAHPEAADARLAELRRLRFRGVYRVTDYAEPKLVRKIDELRPEWLPGVIAASFVVQDLTTGHAVCQTEPIIVRSDLTDAPIGSRTRAATRDRLVLALGQTLRQRTAQVLRRITTELELPRAQESASH